MQKRWLTGVILAAVILVIILIGSTEALAAVITIFIFGGVWEYNNIVFGKGFFNCKSRVRQKIDHLREQHSGLVRAVFARLDGCFCPYPGFFC